MSFELEQEKQPLAPEPFSTRMAIGARASLVGEKNEPVHETMTIAALIAADLAPGATTFFNAPADMKEFCRGVVWNDDPACSIFTDNEQDNWKMPYMALDPSWLDVGLPSKTSPPDAWHKSQSIIGRSHVGDLQFLHAMANKPGDDPAATKHRILLWLEIMYRVSIQEAGFGAQQRLWDVELPRSTKDDPDRWPFRPLFGDRSKPRVTQTLFTLLTCDTIYNAVKLDRRALGTCLHVLQDSYSHGHCRRQPQPHQSQTSAAAQQRPAWTHYGPIGNFHTYLGQDDTRHKHFDFPHTSMQQRSPARLDDFNDMQGVRDGIEASAKLARFWANRTGWPEVERWLADEVFALADATPADTTVD